MSSTSPLTDATLSPFRVCTRSPPAFVQTDDERASRFLHSGHETFTPGSHPADLRRGAREGILRRLPRLHAGLGAPVRGVGAVVPAGDARHLRAAPVRPFR